MICRHCGKEHGGEGEFCPFCGLRNDAGEAALLSSENAEPVPVSGTDHVDKPQTKLLCILSLIFGFGAPAVVYAGNELLDILFRDVSFMQKMTDLTNEIAFLFPVAGLVLMIIARVKDPKSRFGKIVMWIYIAATILTVILAIILIFAFVYAMVSCCESFKNCPG